MFIAAYKRETKIIKNLKGKSDVFDTVKIKSTEKTS